MCVLACKRALRREGNRILVTVDRDPRKPDSLSVKQATFQNRWAQINESTLGRPRVRLFTPLLTVDRDKHEFSLRAAA